MPKYWSDGRRGILDIYLPFETTTVVRAYDRLILTASPRRSILQCIRYICVNRLDLIGIESVHWLRDVRILLRLPR